MNLSSVTHYNQDSFWARKGITLLVPEEKPTSSFLYFHDNLVLQTYLESPVCYRRCRDMDVNSTVKLTDVRKIREKQIYRYGERAYWAKDTCGEMLERELLELNHIDMDRLGLIVEAAE